MELGICEPQAQLDPTMLDLHNEIRQLLAVERKGKLGFMKRERWALYEEKRLKRLLEDVDESVDDF